MTNKEKYKQAFSVLHASEDLSLEVTKMKTNKIESNQTESNKMESNKAKSNKADNHRIGVNSRRFRIRPAFAAGIAAVFLCGGIATAYAADLGGVRQAIQYWLHGKQVTADVTSNGDGSYTFSYEEDGETMEHSGGGLEINDDGTTTALSAEDVAQEMAVDLLPKEDGSVWLYFYDRSFDLTDELKAGNCKVVIEDKGSKWYFDIEDNGSGGYGFTQNSKPTGAAEDYTLLK